MKRLQSADCIILEFGGIMEKDIVSPKFSGKMYFASTPLGFIRIDFSLVQLLDPALFGGYKFVQVKLAQFENRPLQPAVPMVTNFFMEDPGLYKRHNGHRELYYQIR